MNEAMCSVLQVRDTSARQRIPWTYRDLLSCLSTGAHYSASLAHQVSVFLDRSRRYGGGLALAPFCCTHALSRGRRLLQLCWTICRRAYVYITHGYKPQTVQRAANFLTFGHNRAPVPFGGGSATTTFRTHSWINDPSGPNWLHGEPIARRTTLKRP